MENTFKEAKKTTESIFNILNESFNKKKTKIEQCKCCDIYKKNTIEKIEISKKIFQAVFIGNQSEIRNLIEKHINKSISTYLSTIAFVEGE